MTDLHARTDEVLQRFDTIEPRLRLHQRSSCDPLCVELMVRELAALVRLWRKESEKP